MRNSELLRRYLLYGLSGPVIVLNLWVLSQVYRYFEGIITLVALSAVLALLLNYIVDAFQRLGSTRSQAIFMVLMVFVVLLIVLASTLIPILIDQTDQLLQRLPELVQASNQNITWLESLINRNNLPLNLDQITNQLIAQIQGVLTRLPELALNTLGQLFTSVFLIVLAFYMLLYGDRFWKGLIRLLPFRFGEALSHSLQQQFHQFFLSQILLALIMVVCLVPTLLILRIKFTLLFTLIVGLFQVVPLIGPTIGISLVCLLIWGLQGFVPSVQVLVACFVYQQIIDNIIAPRLRGNFTGLNPIWIIISLLLGGRVAGFVGVVLAMPIAATIKSTIEAMRAVEEPIEPEIVVVQTEHKT